MSDASMVDLGELLTVLLAPPSGAGSDNEIVSSRVARFFNCRPMTEKFFLALSSTRGVTEDCLARTSATKTEWAEKLPVITALTALGNVLDYPSINLPIQNIRGQFTSNSASVVSSFADHIIESQGPIGLSSDQAIDLQASLEDVRKYLDVDVINEELKQTFMDLFSVVEYGVHNYRVMKPDVLRLRLLALLATMASITPKTEDTKTRGRWARANRAVLMAVGALTFTASATDQTNKLLKSVVDSIVQIEQVERELPKLIEDQSGKKKADSREERH